MGFYEFYTAYNLKILIDKYPNDLTSMILTAPWRASARGHIVFGVLIIFMGFYFINNHSEGKKRKTLLERLNWTTERITNLELGNLNSSQTSLNKWPWGSHHTEALGHLEAAASRFWKLYDTADQSTAPTNEMVAEWLRDERGVSKEKAYAIASILRADGLKTGPRR